MLSQVLRFWARDEFGKRRQVAEYRHVGADSLDYRGEAVPEGTVEYRLSDGEALERLPDGRLRAVTSALTYTRI